MSLMAARFVAHRSGNPYHCCTVYNARTYALQSQIAAMPAFMRSDKHAARG